MKMVSQSLFCEEKRTHRERRGLKDAFRNDVVFCICYQGIFKFEEWLYYNKAHLMQITFWY